MAKNISDNNHKFGLKIIFILLYIYSKFVKFLKGLADLTILPLPLTFFVSTGLTSEEFSIILTVLIYCIITYEISETLLESLYGDFGRLWWVRIVAIVCACIFCGLFTYVWMGWMFDQSSNIVDPLLFLFALLISGIPVGVVLLSESNMLEWEGAVPHCCTFIFPATEEAKQEMESIKREYKGESDESWIGRKLTRFIPVYMSGFIFILVCVVLGGFFWVFLQSTILFVILISMWFLKDLYDLIGKKCLSKLEFIKKLVETRKAPEEKIVGTLFSFKKHAFTKQITGLICIFGGFGVVAVCNGALIIVAPVAFPLAILSVEDFMTFMIVLMFSINGIALISAFLFQSYFWYILMRRYSRFLDVWTERDCSTEVDVPMLPTGGFPTFLINTILIIFLLCYFLLWSLVYLYLYAPGPLPIELIVCGIAILIPPLSFELYILYSTIKNRKQRETDPKKLYKDNKRIPFAASIQFFSFSALPLIIIFVFGFYASPIFHNLGSDLEWNIADASSKVLYSTLSFFIISCIIILSFYISDIERSTRKKYSREPYSIKRTIKDYSLYFILTFIIFVYGWTSQEIAIRLLGIFAVIVVAIGFILTIVYGKPSTHPIKNRPKK